MKILVLSLFVFLSFNVQAAPLSQIVEKASHALIKLAREGKAPAEVASKTHLMKATETETGYDVLAIMDHNGDHSQTPAHVILKYDKNAKLVSSVYNQGYMTSNPTPFTKASAAKLFDLASEILLDSELAELKDYAQVANVYELEFDAQKNAALFFISATNGKEMKMWLNLDGTLIEYSFQ